MFMMYMLYSKYSKDCSFTSTIEHANCEAGLPDPCFHCRQWCCLMLSRTIHNKPIRFFYYYY